MKHLGKKAVALVLSVLIAMLCLAGCNVQLDSLDDVVAVFGSNSVKTDEAKLYVYHSQFETEESNQFVAYYYFGNYDGFWKYQDMWDGNLYTAMQKLYQTKLLVQIAKQEGMTLTEEELARVDAAVVRTKAEHGRVMDYSGATEEDLRAFYEENALANKFRAKLQEGIDTTFEEDEMRRKSVEGLSIIAKTTVPAETTPSADEEAPEDEEETTAAAEEDTTAADVETEEVSGEDVTEEETTEAEEETTEAEEDTTEADEVTTEAEEDTTEADEVTTEAEEDTTEADEVTTEAEEDTTAAEEEATEEGETEETTTATPYSEEEQEENRKKAEEEILELLKNDTPIADIVEIYQNSKTVNVTSLGSLTITPDDAREDETKEYSAYKELAWDLKTGEIDSVTIQGTSGSGVSYVLHCLNDDDPDLRKEAEEKELATRREHMFQAKYAEYVKANKRFHVYEEKLVNIKYQGPVMTSISITGDDFASLEGEDEDVAGDGEN